MTAANPKQFVNAEEDAVREATIGAAWASPVVTRLDGYPDIKVLIRNDWHKDKVSLISGGGSGHEPMHGGFIGAGMLTGAVIGEVFASPSVNAVLAAIVSTTGPAGCLLIVKNYTGDRLNFTIAAQQARSLFGLQVEMVIVNEDVATEAKRGLAGTIFVHKVAGALAETGASLDEVKATAQEVINSMATLGVSFSTVCRKTPERMGVEEMEVGLGIHGEHGASVQARKPCGEIVRMLVDELLASERILGNDALALMVNNLGGVPPLEMNIILMEVMNSRAGSMIKALVGPAALCTSLDMNGFSLSFLGLKGQVPALLDGPTTAPAWPGATSVNIIPLTPLPFKPHDVSHLAKTTPSKDVFVESLLDRVCHVLEDAKEELDQLDSVVGDGDTGSTLSLGAQRVLDQKDVLPMANPEALCHCLSDIVTGSMGGSSGVLIGILFHGMADALKGTDIGSLNTEVVGRALVKGVESVMSAGGAAEGSRTMLDALIPAAKILSEGGSLGDAKMAAEKGAEATKTMVACSGRSANVPAAVLQGTPDPGAVAVAKCFGVL